MCISVLVGANIATILLMWASCLSTYLSPVIHPRISQAGLLFPVFLCINLLFLAVWLIISWKWMSLTILGILSCWNYVKDYSPLNLGQEQENGEISILSYNVAGFYTNSERGLDGNQTVEYIAYSKADVICLQECPSGGKMYNKLSHKMDSLGYYVKSQKALRIYSRWPFIGSPVQNKSYDLCNGSLAWFINLDGDTTLIINNHLKSNGISDEEKAKYGEAIDSYDKDKMEASGRLLLSRLTHAASKRAEQTDTLCKLIKQHERYRIIVAGDLNDTPISYTYQQISRLLTNTYSQSGNGLGISFNRKGFPVRIDHIFISDNLESHYTYIDGEAHSSDHRPIVARVSKSAK